MSTTTIGVPNRLAPGGWAGDGRRVPGGWTPPRGAAARPAPAPASAPAAAGVRRRADRPLRLTRRGRLVLTTLAGLATIGAIWSGGALAAGPSTPQEVRLHTVVAGETLWADARAVAGPDQDVRDVVDQIMRLNGLSNANLRAGQVIVLPVG